MNTNTILWVVGGGIALIAISVVVNITIINPRAPETSPAVVEETPVEQPSAEQRTGLYDETAAEREARQNLCDPIQEKINAEIEATGKRGISNFSPSLQAEIKAVEGKCRLIGDSDGF